MMIEVQGLTKTFQKGDAKIEALKNVNVKIEKGEFAAVTGPSGSGKSTFLLSVAGLIALDAGQVLYNGRDLTGMRVGERAHFRAKELGFVFQTFHLVPYLSAIENVQTAAYLAGAGKAAQQEAAQRALKSVGLADRLDHWPAELSVGERQRVAIARAMVNQPSTILADEPTGNLDPDTSRDVIGLLKRFASEGATVVMVTHDPQAASLADRRLVLEQGVLSA